MLGALHTIGVAINENIEIKPPSVAAHHAPFILKKQAKSKKPLIVGLATLVIIGIALSLKLSGTTENKGDSTKISPANGSAKRIALVPFRNIGPQQEDSFLAEGMHEEIEAMLSMAPNLMVKDGSRFKEQANDAGAIGKALQVEAIVTGSVRRPPVNFV